MNYKTITCSHCGLDKDIFIGEYNRKIKKGTAFFCSQSCTAKASIPKFLEATKEYKVSPKNKQHLQNLNRIRSENVEPFKYFLKNCRRRHKDFDLSIEYLKTIWQSQNGLCALTGITLELPYGTKGFNTVKPFNGASLDRIDSSIGYVPDNVQFISMGINFLKNDWDQDYLIKHLIVVSKSVLDKYKEIS